MQVINGNNIDILKQYPDNHFDAVVTDPPYGLGKEPNAEELMKDWIDKGFHEVSGSGFMGKEWDAFVPQPIFWKEVFRVLKPGGHVLAFYGTRTYDWGVMAMRFAGFEVRDCIQWIYGSGFPKSHNIGKAIDKLKGNDRVEVGKYKLPDVSDGLRKKDWDCNAKSENSNFGASGQNILTKGFTEWEGYGTALKPANEPIVLARKPLEKGLSIAENILKWGVGGINIDASRISTNGETWNVKNNLKPFNDSKGWNDNSTEGIEHPTHPQGRFPANIILTHHEDCVCKGTKKVGKGERRQHEDGEVSSANKGYTRPNKSSFTHKDSSVIANYGQEEVEDWDCVEGGKLIAPCIYINGHEISIFNLHEFDLIQQHREFYHNSVSLYSHNKDKYNFLDCETFHDLGWKQLPSFRVDYLFLSHFYDALVQTFQVYDQLSFQQLNDALYVVHHFLELLHNHLYLDHDLLSMQNDSLHDSLAQHILQNKAFYSVFLKKISYHNSDILFQELAKNDSHDSTYENNIFEDFLSYLTKMGLNNSNILHLHQMLFCLSLQINFTNQIYYKEFELPSCPIRILDEQSGILKSGGGIKNPLKNNPYGSERTFNPSTTKGNESLYNSDKGGASRFFYVAKASKSERNKGLDGFDAKQMAWSNQAKAELKRGNTEFADDTKMHNKVQERINFHPTVKPIKLMQYLVKMITPPNGIVLDPFCGSGTTGVACKIDGFQFVGLEQDPEYCKIAQARINNFVSEVYEIQSVQEQSKETKINKKVKIN